MSRRSFLVAARRALPTGVYDPGEMVAARDDTYSTSVGICKKYVPFRGCLMAEPAMGTRGIPMLSVLPTELAELYSNERRLLAEVDVLDEQLERENRMYCKVPCDRDEYMQSLSRPEVWDLWDLQSHDSVRATCSVAAVPKKEGDMLRKILMVAHSITLCPLFRFSWVVTQAMGYLARAHCRNYASVGMSCISLWQTKATLSLTSRFHLLGGVFKLRPGCALEICRLDLCAAALLRWRGFTLATSAWLWDTVTLLLFRCPSTSA